MNWTLALVFGGIIIMGIVALFYSVEEFPEIDSVSAEDDEQDS